MNSRDLQRQLPSGADQLRQHLIHAVNRLDQQSIPRALPHDNQQSLSVSPSTIQQSSSYTPFSSVPPPSSLQSSTLPFSPVSRSFSPVSSTPPPTSLASTLQRQSTSVFCTDPLRRTFLWNPRSCIGQKRGQNFKKGGNKKKKVPTWTHMFVCLSNTNQEEVPGSDERASLQLAGLGEKRVTLNAYSEMEDIYEELMFQFPKLRNAGGFELLRVPEGAGKLLQIIASPESGYTVSYLRAVVHHAKIYIRPMQKSLCTEPQECRVSEKLWYTCVIILLYIIPL